MNKKSGFTLIEVVVTLVLVGIMASVAGIGISSAAKGYVFAKKNIILAGKAQVALARMSREVLELKDISTPYSTYAGASSISIEKITEAVAFGQSGTEIRLAKGVLGSAPNYTNGDVLTDQVAAGGLQLAYKKGANNWSTSDNINLLSQVIITLTMSDSGAGQNFTFSTSIIPRNNGNRGGEPPLTSSGASSNIPGRYNCFVATAAYGNPYHPMVLFLKQFRDQYLEKWPGGPALIQLYYKYGPYIAAFIHDKSWACAMTRIILLPFVGVSFLLVYAQGSIPFVLLIFVSGLLFFKRYSGRFKFMGNKSFIYKQNGSVLLGIIITMVIMAFLGAALLSLTSSSTASNAYNVLQQKAFYLAESGYRYAASEYINVVDNDNDGMNGDQNLMAYNLNGRTMNMPEGTVLLGLTPFNYVYYNSSDPTASAPIGSNQLPVRFAGNTPSGFDIPSTGKILIKTQTRANAATAYTTHEDIYDYAGFSSSTFTLSTGLAHTVSPWTSITILASPSSNQTVVPNMNTALTTNRLTLNNSDASAGAFFMPMRNGRFKVRGSGTSYRYAYRVDNNNSTTTLYGITNGDDPASTTSFSVTTASLIVPKDYLTLTTQGTVNGNVQRTLTYYVPLDVTSLEGGGAKINTTDSFEAGVAPNTNNPNSHWYTPVHGTFDVPASVADGGKTDGTSGMAALRLTSSYNWFSSGKYFSLLALKWNADYANFGSTWFANNKTLSYDAQVKVKYNNQDYYQSGLLFRMNLDGLTSGSLNDTSWLSVSFMRGNTAFFETDGMYASALPIDNTPLIVLWKKDTGDHLSRIKWIAYKRLDTHDFNNGVSFNNGDYRIRGKTSGARDSITVSGSNGSTGWFASKDDNWLYGRFIPGEELVTIEKVCCTQLTTNAVSFSASTSSGSVTSFSRGSDRNDNGPAPGDIIIGISSGATARITAISRTGGSWWWSSASGSISVDQRKGNFSNGEICYTYRPAATKIANYLFSLADVLELNSSEKINPWSTIVLRLEEKSAATGPFSGQYVNDIKIYLGDTQGRATPTGNPLDMPRHGGKRWSNPPVAGDVQWPAESGWSTSSAASACCSDENINKDYFTLVRGWVFNTAASDVNANYALTGTAEESNSTIRTIEFTTHSMGTFNQNELGLWTSGNSSANNVYFDDFAVRLEEARSVVGFTTPLME